MHVLSAVDTDLRCKAILSSLPLQHAKHANSCTHITATNIEQIQYPASLAPSPRLTQIQHTVFHSSPLLYAAKGSPKPFSRTVHIHKLNTTHHNTVIHVLSQIGKENLRKSTKLLTMEKWSQKESYENMKLKNNHVGNKNQNWTTKFSVCHQSAMSVQYLP